MHSPSVLSHQEVRVLQKLLTEALDDQLLIITRQPCELSLDDFLENSVEDRPLIESEEDYERLEAHYGVDTWRGEIVTFDFNGAGPGGIELLRKIPIHSQDEIWEARGDEDLMRQWQFGNVPAAPLETQEMEIEQGNNARNELAHKFGAPGHPSNIDIRDLYESEEELLAAQYIDDDYNEFLFYLSRIVEQDDIGLILLLENHYNFHFVARISEHSLAFRARQRNGQDD